MLIHATLSYENDFEIEVDDNATSEEIIEIIAQEDTGLGGDWDIDWDIIEQDDDDEE